MKRTIFAVALNHHSQIQVLSPAFLPNAGLVYQAIKPRNSWRIRH